MTKNAARTKTTTTQTLDAASLEQTTGGHHHHHHGWGPRYYGYGWGAPPVAVAPSTVVINRYW